MAIKSITVLKTDLPTVYNDNIIKEITPARVRGQQTDIIDSFDALKTTAPQWSYDDSATVGTGIAAGRFRFNNADPMSATQVFISAFSLTGVEVNQVFFVRQQWEGGVAWGFRSADNEYAMELTYVDNVFSGPNVIGWVYNVANLTSSPVPDEKVYQVPLATAYDYLRQVKTFTHPFSGASSPGSVPSFLFTQVQLMNFGTQGVSKSSHGFTVGQVLRLNPANGQLTAAANTSEALTIAVGSVTGVPNANAFVFMPSGPIAPMPNVGQTGGQVLYLTASGALTVTKPTTPGEYVKRYAVAINDSELSTLNMTGSTYAGILLNEPATLIP